MFMTPAISDFPVPFPPFLPSLCVAMFSPRSLHRHSQWWIATREVRDDLYPDLRGDYLPV